MKEYDDRERHGQSIGIALAIAGIIWIASSINSTPVHLAHIDEQLVATQMAVKEMYRADDAKRDNADTTAKLGDLNRRVEALERAFNTRGVNAAHRD